GLNGKEPIASIQKRDGRGIVVGEGSWQSRGTIPPFVVVVVVFIHVVWGPTFNHRFCHELAMVPRVGLWVENKLLPRVCAPFSRSIMLGLPLPEEAPGGAFLPDINHCL